MDWVHQKCFKKHCQLASVKYPKFQDSQSMIIHWCGFPSRNFSHKSITVFAPSFWASSLIRRMKSIFFSLAAIKYADFNLLHIINASSLLGCDMSFGTNFSAVLVSNTSLANTSTQASTTWSHSSSSMVFWIEIKEVIPSTYFDILQKIVDLVHLFLPRNLYNCVNVNWCNR